MFNNFKQFLKSFCIIFSTVAIVLCSGMTMTFASVLLDPNIDKEYAEKLVKNDYEGVEEYLDTIQQKKPFEFQYYSGIMNGKLNRYSAALRHYSKAIELQPNNGYLYEYRALLYLNNGEKQKAVADIDKAIKYLPNERNPYAYKLIIALKEYDIPKALEYIYTMENLPAREQDSFSNTELELFKTQLELELRDSKFVKF